MPVMASGGINAARDKKTRRVSTGFNGDADYVWQGWKYVNSVTSAENVTRRVWDAIEAHLKEQTI